MRVSKEGCLTQASKMETGCLQNTIAECHFGQEDRAEPGRRESAVREGVDARTMRHVVS